MADTRLEAWGPTSNRFKLNVPAQPSTTFEIGQLVIIEPSVGKARPLLSGSGEAGVQCVGIVTQNQVVPSTGGNIEIETGRFVLSGSGFTVDEIGKIVYAADSTTMYDAHSAGRHAVGRLVAFDTSIGSSIGNNIVVDVASVRSGTTI
jgi:hypothetical protein